MSGYQGMHAARGVDVGGLAHLRQSVADILTTPIGSRVMRRSFGARLFDLVDRPANAATLMQLYAATALALARWEPRLSLQSVAMDDIQRLGEGRIGLTLTGVYMPEGRPVRLEGIVL